MNSSEKTMSCAKDSCHITTNTLSVVPVRITNPEVVHSDQYLMSNVDPLFEAQYPDVSTIPLMHHTMDKNPQDLAVFWETPVSGYFQRIRQCNRFNF